MNQKNVKKKVIGLILSAVTLLLIRILPTPPGLSQAGLAAIGFWIAAIFAWIGESMPFSISTILLIVLMPYYGIIELNDVWSNFASSTFFFIFASFAITAALATSNIPKKFANTLVQIAGGSPFTLLLGFMLGTGIISAVMSNVPATALFLTIALSIMQPKDDLQPNGFAKCVMIGIPYAAVIGGFMTPVGTAVNLVAISLYEQATGNTIRFLDWMLVGIPVAILCILICCAVLVRLYCPKGVGQIELRQEQSYKVQLDQRDYRILTIIAIMFVFWLGSTWVPQINNTIVAILGMGAFFAPGIRTVNMRQMEENTSLDVLMMVGGVQVLALGLTRTGAASWLAKTCFSGIETMPKLAIYLLIAVFACVLHLFVPLGSAVSGIVTIPVIELANLCGLNLPASVMLGVFWSSVALILPTDCTTMLAYKHGYFTMRDISKSGIVCTVLTLVSSTIVTVFLSNLIL